MSKRILIIDDEANIRRVIRLTLEAAGYEVGEASDGERGLEAYKDGSTWDAVLLDQKMPGMGGLETLRHIKERRPGARVVMATAFASIELAVDAMKLGAADFVRKPMTPEILRNAVTAALEKPATAATRPAPAAAPAGEASEQPFPLITMITLNGFQFWPAEGETAEAANPYERRFKVRNPRGWEQEVVVEIDEEAVGDVERMIRRRLPPESSFWTSQAERYLSTFLWNESQIPSGKLTLRSIDPDHLTIAERWKDH